ncbi:MAG TPA: hypothetical protein VFA66_04855 [Gaiellaceae bacterium]|nr:hypothetical protein [Gaiellaceae bacterium]
MDEATVRLVVASLENGASVDESAALAHLTRKELESEWLNGMRDAEQGIASTAATLYLEGRAATARWKVGLRARASDGADAGHRSAGDHLRLLEEAASRDDPGAPNDVRQHMFPVHDAESRRLAAELLWRISAPGPGPSRAEREAAGEEIGKPPSVA